MSVYDPPASHLQNRCKMTLIGNLHRPENYCWKYKVMSNYSPCTNCGSAGYGTYSQRNCFGGDTQIGPHGRFLTCGTRERMRSIYDTRVHASDCNTYGGDYYGAVDPFRRNPYGIIVSQPDSASNAYGHYVSVNPSSSPGLQAREVYLRQTQRWPPSDGVSYCSL